MTKLTFDDIDTSDGGIGALADGYGGIDWHNVYALPANGNPGSGIERGATSGEQVAINGSGDLAVLSMDHGTFDLKSVEMTAAWDLKLRVGIDAYHGADHVVHRIVTLSDAGPRRVHIGAQDVDHVVFSPILGSGVHDPALVGSGNVIAFDDMRIADGRHDAAALGVQHLVPQTAGDHFLQALVALA